MLCARGHISKDIPRFLKTPDLSLFTHRVNKATAASQMCNQLSVVRSAFIGIVTRRGPSAVSVSKKRKCQSKDWLDVWPTVGYSYWKEEWNVLVLRPRRSKSKRPQTRAHCHECVFAQRLRHSQIRFIAALDVGELWFKTTNDDVELTICV